MCCNREEINSEFSIFGGENDRLDNFTFLVIGVEYLWVMGERTQDFVGFLQLQTLGLGLLGR